MMPHALIFGHSIVKQFGDRVNRVGEVRLHADLKLPETCTVEIAGQRGLTLHRLLHENKIQKVMERLDRIPNVMFLQIGDNDFRLETEAQDLAMDMLALASLLKGRFGVEKVMFGALLPRFESETVGKWALSAQEAQQYNNWADLVLTFQEEAFEDIPFVTAWRHNHRFDRSKQQYCRRDGVHLSSQGLHHFYKSLRGALIAAFKTA
jgi:lysophospholipase L1-like esterase